jgi:hypothetical protein
LLLQEVLVEMLSLMPGVKLVDADCARVDMVIISAVGHGAFWPERIPAAAAKAARVIAVDAVHNRIRVRERRDGRLAERQIDGSMVLLPEMMRQWLAGADPTIAETA